MLERKRIFSSIWSIFLEISAIFAEKIKFYNEKEVMKNYELFIVLFYNGLFSTFFSAICSFFMALGLAPFTQNLCNNWYAFFKIVMVLNCLMLFVNLLSRNLNVPMIFMQVVNFLRSKFKSFRRFFYYLFGVYIIVVVFVFILCSIFWRFFIEYGISNENAFIYSLIVSIGLTVAGFYSFPVKKDFRDINELLISPLFITINISLAYMISKENILNNAAQGHDDMVSNLLIMFLITASIQIITYLKKLFEKLHDLPDYENEIHIYAKSAMKKLEFIKLYFREIITQLNQIIEEYKLIKKDKYFYFRFIASIIFGLIIVMAVSYFNDKSLLHLSQKDLDKSVSGIIKYIVLFGLILFLIDRFFTFLILALKGKEGIKKSKRWEYFGLALFGLGMLIPIIVSVIPYRNPHIILVAGLFLFVAAIIFRVTSFIEWLFSKRRTEE